MNGRILSEEEIKAVSEHYEWDNFDDDAQAAIHDLIATVRDRENQLKQSQQSHFTDVKAYIELKQQLADRDKIIEDINREIYRKSWEFDMCSLGQDELREEIANLDAVISDRDKIITDLKSELNDSKYAETYAVEAGRQNTVMCEALEQLTKVVLQDFKYANSYADFVMKIARETLAKVNNV